MGMSFGQSCGRLGVSAAEFVIAHTTGRPDRFTVRRDGTQKEHPTAGRVPS